MSIGTNILFFRKNLGMTQEEFAEMLSVSRQTVSKWESDSCYPEMEKILSMTEIFNCGLDTLVKGDAEKSIADDTCGYDGHSNRFIKKICTGIVLTMLGVCSMLLLDGFKINEYVAMSVFFLFLIPAASFFIIAGIQNDSFHNKNKIIPYFYKQSETEAFDKKFPVLIVTAISIVLAGLIFLFAVFAYYGENAFDTDDKLSAVSMAVFLLFVTAGGTLAAYAGMMKSKYNIKEYNEDRNPKLRSKASRIKGAVCGSIMLIAAAFFIITMFVYRGNINQGVSILNYSWLSFVIGGILCGIASAIIDAAVDDEN